MERLAGRVILLWGWRRALAAWLAGALFAFAQAPYDFFAVGFVSFPILVWLLDGAVAGGRRGALGRIGAAFATGWWFGFGYFVAGLWWTGTALLVEADLFAWALPLAVLGLPAGLAIFYGIATAIARLLWSDDLGRIAALAAGFAIAEWLRSFVFTGFPWNAAGHAAMPIPELMQSLAVVGMDGINALAVFVFALPAMFASQRHRRAGVVLGLAIALLHAGFGFWRLGTAEAQGDGGTNVRIVQPSIAQDEKWDRAIRDRIFATYLELSTLPVAEGRPAPQLVIWPETAVPYFFSERPDALVAIGQMLDDGQTLLAGAVRVEAASGAEPARYYNSIIVIDQEGQIVDAADKVHLVPFGEYLPFADLLQSLGARQLVQSVSAFSAAAQRHVLEAGGTRFLPFICYEIIFPGTAGHGDAGADYLLNVTNDAWFGDTPGPYQHLRQAQMRAVEAGRPLVRAANNGISAIVDPYGRIIDALAIDAVGVLDAQLPASRASAPTPLDPRLAGGAIVLILLMASLVARIGAGRHRN